MEINQLADTPVYYVNCKFRLGIRHFGDATEQQSGGMFAFHVRPGLPASNRDVQFRADANRLEIAIPLRDIGYSRHCALNVDSLFAGIQVDRTGYRFMDL